MTTENLDIEIKTIKMQPSAKSTDKGQTRKAATNSEIFQQLVTKEAFLRRLAYKNTTIKTDESFFDDSDMKSEYYLVIVYDKASGTPLLSARHYFDKSLIAKFLKGDSDLEIDLSKFNLDNYTDGKIFLADRLSGNISSSIYRKYRADIFSLYYSEIVNNNRNSSLLLMVRKEKRNKQLAKYLSLGFTIIGSTLHKGKEHSIILRDLFL